MSKINGKELCYAATPGPIFVEGAGSFGPSLSTTSTGTKVLKMTIEEPWVILEIKRDRGQGSALVPVPLTSFTHTVLAKEKASVAQSSKAADN